MPASDRSRYCNLFCFCQVAFAKIIVPTIDTLRNGYMLEYAFRNKVHMLVCGNTGTGKTVLAQQALESLTDTECKITLNFSAATSSLATQDVSVPF